MKFNQLKDPFLNCDYSQINNGSELLLFGSLQRRIAISNSRLKLFDERNFQLDFYSYLDDFVEKNGITTLSFDVFDTLLLRDNSSELERFYEIGELISLDLAKRGFKISDADAFLARQAGTECTYRASEKKEQCREGSIYEIHNVSSKILTGTNRYAELLVEIEISFEKKCITKCDLFYNYIKNFLKKKNRSVILISDIYLHVNQIKELLNDQQINISLFDGIFSSADEKISKHSIKIYNHVCKKLKINPSNILHVGDNLRSDFINARNAGYHSLHFPISDNEIKMRQASHDDYTKMLKDKLSLSHSIARPS